MSSKTIAVAAVAAFALLSLPSLADARRDADEPPSREVTGRNDIEGEIVGNEIAGSPFTRLEIGMPRKEVEDLIGDEIQGDAECGAYFTGKSFIPFHFGGDKMREECAYKGLGRLVFTNQSDFNSRSYLIKIEYDASENGYRDD